MCCGLPNPAIVRRATGAGRVGITIRSQSVHACAQRFIVVRKVHSTPWTEWKGKKGRGISATSWSARLGKLVAFEQGPRRVFRQASFARRDVRTERRWGERACPAAHPRSEENHGSRLRICAPQPLVLGLVVFAAAARAGARPDRRSRVHRGRCDAAWEQGWVAHLPGRRRPGRPRLGRASRGARRKSRPEDLRRLLDPVDRLRGDGAEQSRPGRDRAWPGRVRRGLELAVRVGAPGVTSSSRHRLAARDLRAVARSGSGGAGVACSAGTRPRDPLLGRARGRFGLPHSGGRCSPTASSLPNSS